MALDLSSPASVRSFASKFESLQLPLNFLINNAGNHFLLTKLLLNTMIETVAASGVQGRIVNVLSAIHGWFSGDMI
ncbi:hypothetical protein DVH24_008886 [Malus domestica]|uniref:Uncharacterized protein n=1 Tax=Malus domestica TaxID=3750 RepID=A0A498JS42_MALDO|nr:hypothetical protein DVH24_008886 [Malus domestica]